MPDENKKSSPLPNDRRCPFRLTFSSVSTQGAIAIIILLGLLTFGNTTLNGFVYDDCEVVENNWLITSFRNIPILFSRAYFHYTPELSYRPVVTLSYFFDYALFDGVAEGYHFVNVLVHIINALLVFFLLRKINQISETQSPQKNNFISFCGALFFLLHPVVTEPVNLISYREDLLCTCFVLISFILYLNLKMPRFTINKSFLYVVACFTFFLALLSKESAVTFPFTILAFESLFNRYLHYQKQSRIMHPTEKLTRQLRALSGFFIVLLLYLVLRFFIATPPQRYTIPYFGDSPLRALLNFPRFFAYYLFLIFYPVNLSADYTFIPIKTIFHPLIIGGWLVVMVYFVVLWYLWLRRQFLIAFGLLWFVVFIAPVSNIYPLANPVAERYLYLPLVGSAMSVSGIIRLLMPRNETSKVRMFLQKLAMVFFVVLLLLYAFRDIKRNTVWRSDATLWTETLSHHPRSSAALKGLGLVYLREKKFDAAEQMFRRALQIIPRDIKTRNNLAVLYAKKGELDKAIAEFKSILQYAPGYGAAHYNLARCYASLNPPNVELALREAETARRLGYPVPDEFLLYIQSIPRKK